MDALLKAVAMYLFLMLLFRLAGRRSLAELTAFDFILLLIVGEATQQALLGEDFSLLNAFLVIATLISLDILLSALKNRFPLLAKMADGIPMVIVEDGKPLEKRMQRARISVSDVLQTARETQGIESLDQIRFAIIEVSGGISIIPKK